MVSALATRCRTGRFRFQHGISCPSQSLSWRGQVIGKRDLTDWALASLPVLVFGSIEPGAFRLGVDIKHTLATP